MSQRFLPLQKSLFTLCFGAMLLTGCGGGSMQNRDTDLKRPSPPIEPTVKAPLSAQDWYLDPEFQGKIVNTPPDMVNLTNARLNAHHAYGAGYSGTGQRIAILDSGFRQTHREIRDQIIGRFGILRSSTHGTHVAAIAAGARNQNGILGVAYDAKLHLSSLYNESNRVTPSHWAAATKAAQEAGAIVQNNSWRFDRGVTLEEAQNALDTTGSLSAALVKLTQENRTFVLNTATQEDWQSFLNALRDFQKTGVIVKSITNDNAHTFRAENIANLHAALPTIAPELRGAWITVANVTREGNQAELHSAPCAEAAAYCLSVNGMNVLSASSQADNSYIHLTGTSMAAPQVSGAIAILAEAFPSLSPQELTTRLLATADNQFFTADHLANFGNGVTHGYSEHYGHGSPDLKAALTPVGGLGLATGKHIQNTRSSLEQSQLHSSAAAGDALKNALAQQTLVVFDSLGTPFTMPASALIQAPQNAQREFMARLSLLGAYGGRAMLVTEAQTPEQRAALTAFQSHHAPGAYLFIRQGRFGFSAGRAANLEDAASFAVVTPEFSGIYGPTNNAISSRASYHLNDSLALSARGFNAATLSGGHYTGMGSEFVWKTPRLTLSLGVDATLETGAAGGIRSGGAFALKHGQHLASRLAAEWRLSDTLALYGAYLAGTVNSHGDLTRLEQGRLEAFTLGIKGQHLLTQSDQWSVSLSQPTRLTGILNFTAATGRQQDGRIQYQRQRHAFAPSGQERALHLRYETDFAKQHHVSIGLSLHHDYGHIAGKRALSALLGYRMNF